MQINNLCGKLGVLYKKVCASAYLLLLPHATFWIAINKSASAARVLIGQNVDNGDCRILDCALLTKEVALTSWLKSRLGEFFDTVAASKIRLVLTFPYAEVVASNVEVASGLSGAELNYFLQHNLAQFCGKDNEQVYFDYQVLSDAKDCLDQKLVLLIAAERSSVAKHVAAFDQRLLHDAILDVDLYAFLRAAQFHSQNIASAANQVTAYLHLDEELWFLVILENAKELYRNARDVNYVERNATKISEQVVLFLQDGIKTIDVVATKITNMVLSGSLVDQDLVDGIAKKVGVPGDLYSFSKITFRNVQVEQKFKAMALQMVVSFGLLLRGKDDDY